MERYSPVRTRSRPPGLWSSRSLRRTIGLAPTSAVVGDRRMRTRSSPRMAVGTIPQARRHPDDEIQIPPFRAQLIAAGPQAGVPAWTSGKGAGTATPLSGLIGFRVPSFRLSPDVECGYRDATSRARCPLRSRRSATATPVLAGGLQGELF